MSRACVCLATEWRGPEGQEPAFSREALLPGGGQWVSCRALEAGCGPSLLPRPHGDEWGPLPV